eukprot:jgi/Tetstr1/454100/TSEL_041019.t1
MTDIERGCEALAVGGDGDVVSTRTAILGDKPGSGKSYVVAALLLECGVDHIPRSAPLRRCISSHMSVTTRPGDDGTALPLNVLVVPHNIVSQWSAVLAAFSAGPGDDERYTVVSRTGDLGRADEVISQVGRGESPVRLMMASASLYPDIVTILHSNQYRATRVVFDEADSLRFRTPLGRGNVARFYWFVTASIHNLFAWGQEPHPLVLQHTSGEERSFISGYRPACSSAHIRSFFAYHNSAWARFIARTIVVADNAFIDTSFDLVPPETFRVPCTAPLHTRVMSGIASREILARLNAGDLDTALMYMHPERTDSEPNIIAAALAQLEMDLDNARAVLDFVQRRRYATREQGSAAVRRQEEMIGNVKARIQDATECLICYSPMANKTVVPCCSNSFCLSCITTWVTSSYPSCPMCKRMLHTTDFLVCRDGAARASPEKQEYEAGGVTFDRRESKAHNLGVLLRGIARGRGEGAPARKLLLFCDNEYALENTGRRVMRSVDIPFAALKGNAASINKRVREFNEADGPRALLINCTHYGCGLNLSGATDVIIFHAMDARMDKQIIGRAQRAPRSSRLRVWRFTNCTEQGAADAGAPPRGTALEGV